MPRPATLTTEDPAIIDAECVLHFFPAGLKWGVFTSPWQLTGRPFAFTVGFPVARVIALQ